MSRHLGKAVKRACEGSLCTRDQEPVGKGRPPEGQSVQVRELGLEGRRKSERSPM